jgi:hypothetical protein
MFKRLTCLSVVAAIASANTNTIYEYSEVLEKKASFLVGEWENKTPVNATEEKGCVPTGKISFKKDSMIPYITLMTATNWIGGNCTKVDLKENTLKVPYASASSYQSIQEKGAIKAGDLYYSIEEINTQYNNNPTYLDNLLTVKFEMKVLADAEPFTLQKDVSIHKLRDEVPRFFTSSNWTTYTPYNLKENPPQSGCCVPHLISEVAFIPNPKNEKQTEMHADRWVGTKCTTTVNHNITFEFDSETNWKTIKDNRIPYNNDGYTMTNQKTNITLPDETKHESITLKQGTCSVTLIRPVNRPGW